MATAPNDYRDPKVTNVEEKKSSAGSIIPWVLLALGVLALLAWLLGFFGSDTETVVPVETTVEEPVVTPAPDATVVTPAPDATVETPAPDATVVTPAPDATETPAPDATAPNATDVETTIVPITPVDPEAPVDGTAAPTDTEAPADGTVVTPAPAD